MIMPLPLRSSRFLQVPIHSRMPLRIAITVSVTNFGSKGTAHIREVVPITNRILKILLPTIFPIAIPTFPFRASCYRSHKLRQGCPESNNCKSYKSFAHTKETCDFSGSFNCKIAAGHNQASAYCHKQNTFPQRNILCFICFLHQPLFDITNR